MAKMMTTPAVLEGDLLASMKTQAARTVRQHVADEAEADLFIEMLGVGETPPDPVEPLESGFDDRGQAQRRRRAAAAQAAMNPLT